MRGRDVGEEEHNLASYREEVAFELERRVERVKRIDGEISALEHRLMSARLGGRIPNGTTARLLTQVAFCEKLLRDKQRLQRERDEAAEDVQRAQERLAQVEAEMSEAGGDAHEAEDSMSGED